MTSRLLRGHRERFQMTSHRVRSRLAAFQTTYDPGMSHPEAPLIGVRPDRPRFSVPSGWDGYCPVVSAGAVSPRASTTSAVTSASAGSSV